MIRRALLLPLVLGACAAQSPAPTASPRPGADSPDAALMAACRSAAEDVMNRRERAQLFRTDDRESREGPFGMRNTSERLAVQFDRDRYIRDCVRRNEPAGN